MLCHDRVALAPRFRQLPDRVPKVALKPCDLFLLIGRSDLAANAV